MLAAELLRPGTADRDATRHPAPAVFSLGQRSRLVRHSRRQRPLEAVQRPALASGSQCTSEPVHLVGDAQQPKSRPGAQLSLPSRCLRTETAVLVVGAGPTRRPGLPVAYRPVGRIWVRLGLVSRYG